MNPYTMYQKNIFGFLILGKSGFVITLNELPCGETAGYLNIIYMPIFVIPHLMRNPGFPVKTGI